MMNATWFRNLKLIESCSVPTGVMHQRYQPAWPGHLCVFYLLLIRSKLIALIRAARSSQNNTTDTQTTGAAWLTPHSSKVICCWVKIDAIPRYCSGVFAHNSVAKMIRVISSLSSASSGGRFKRIPIVVVLKRNCLTDLSCSEIIETIRGKFTIVNEYRSYLLY